MRISDLHWSDCAVHNENVPELFGPCDCGLNQEQDSGDHGKRNFAERHLGPILFAIAWISGWLACQVWYAIGWARHLY